VLVGLGLDLVLFWSPLRKMCSYSLFFIDSMKTGRTRVDGQAFPREPDSWWIPTALLINHAHIP
jgi:hypothetical protein